MIMVGGQTRKRDEIKRRTRSGCQRKDARQVKDTEISVFGYAAESKFAKQK